MNTDDLLTELKIAMVYDRSMSVLEIIDMAAKMACPSRTETSGGILHDVERKTPLFNLTNQTIFEALVKFNAMRAADKQRQKTGIG
jgi:hypothetical protein